MTNGIHKMLIAAAAAAASLCCLAHGLAPAHVAQAPGRDAWSPAKTVIAQSIDTALLGTREAVQPRYPLRDDVTDTDPETGWTGLSLPREYQAAMHAASMQEDVPYLLSLAVCQYESGFDPDEVSGTDDYGLMQINAGNFGWLRELGFEPLDPESNIRAGVYILGLMLRTYGSVDEALMAYNMGPSGAAALWRRGVYETAYTKAVRDRLLYWTEFFEKAR